jgi:hypothetical protein
MDIMDELDQTQVWCSPSRSRTVDNGGNGEKMPRQGYVSWTHFVAEIYERFDTNTNHLGRLTKLKQSGTVEDFIASFERLAFRTEGMSDVFF